MMLAQYILLDDLIYEPIENFQCQSSQDCNGEICSQTTHQCICRYNQYGQQCNMTKDQCKQSVCNNNGECIQETLQCECQQDYIMQYCNFTLDGCKLTLCNNNGNCIYNETDYTATCNCTQQFQGQYCDQCSEQYILIGQQCEPVGCVQENTLTVCNNGGECLFNQQIDQYQCNCTSSYQGTYCESCAKGYVDFNGRCTTEACVTGNTVCYDRGYCNVDHCMCDDDYYGQQCEFVCSCNNGQCVRGQCTCQEGYSPMKINSTDTTCVSNNCINDSKICSGHPNLCQNDVCDCQYNGSNLNGQYCQNNCADYCTYGTCYTDLETQQIMCQCPQYMTGDKCDQYDCPAQMIPLNGTCTYESCLTKDHKICNNHGVCLLEQQVCQCEPNWFEEKCDQSQYQCNQQRCQGKGTCNSNGTCTCNNGLIGSNCTSCNSTEILIDNVCVDQNCLSDYDKRIICNNQGVCQQGVCICNEEYTYKQCQLTQDECTQQYCSGTGKCNIIDNTVVCQCDYLNQGQNCSICEVSEEVVLVQEKFCVSVQCAYQDTICSNQGVCQHLQDNNGVCVCNQSYYGLYCEISEENCNQMICNGKGQCYNIFQEQLDQQQQSQSFDIQIRRQQKQQDYAYFVSESQQIMCNCTQHYLQPNCTICPENHTIFLGQCIQNGWFDPQDTTICNQHGYIGYDAICVCDQEYIGRTCNLTQNNCDQQLCNQRGLCDELGHYCTCDKDNYKGEFCQSCNSGYIGSDCINSTPVIISVIVVLVVIIIIVVVVIVVIYKKRVRMGQMKQIKQTGFGFNQNQRENYIIPGSNDIKI